LISFGPVGIFIGPVVLAVTYKLIEEWVDEEGGASPVGADDMPLLSAEEIAPLPEADK
jgi:predicted PurR-regulated permease PerM